jgi:hypothetical protein
VKKRRLTRVEFCKIYLPSILILLLFGFFVINSQEAMADTQDVYYIENGGQFSLKIGQTVTLQFKGFSDREISLVAIKNDNVILKYGSTEYLKVGEEITSYETVEMLVILKLQRINGEEALFNITYHSAPPAPQIWFWQKIKIIPFPK